MSGSAAAPGSAGMSRLADVLHQGKIVPVVQLPSAQAARPLAVALAAGGLTAIEITFRTGAAAAAIAAVADQTPLVVGAGTVRTVDQAREAVAAGARFVVSPGLSVPVAEYCLEAGIQVIPGVATASEIMTAADLGLNVLKFFPARPLGGVAALRALHGPFPDIRFVPTGGISPADLPGYLSLASVLAVGGSWVAPAGLVAAGDWDSIERLAHDAASVPRELPAAPAGGPSAFSLRLRLAKVHQLCGTILADLPALPRN